MADRSPIEPLLTIDDVADRCQVSTRTVRRWIKSGDLRAIRLGRQLRVRPIDLENLLKKGVIWVTALVLSCQVMSMSYPCIVNVLVYYCLEIVQYYVPVIVLLSCFVFPCPLLSPLRLPDD